MPTSARRHVALLLLAAWAAPLPAAEFAIDPAVSVVTALTHKGGFASGLAHDHLILVPIPSGALAFDPEHPEATRWQGRLAVEALDIDPPAARSRWQGRLRELGALDRDLGPVDEGERRKVRSAALAAGQLDAARFPEIEGEVLGVVPRAGGEGSAFPWSVRFRLTLHGRTVVRDLPAGWRLEGDALTVELLGEYTFSEFGIEPYSAFLGAVRNQDRFHLYAALSARATRGEDGP